MISFALRCLLRPMSVPDDGQATRDHLHHLLLAPGLHPAPTYAWVAPLPTEALHQPKEVLPHWAAEGEEGPKS